MPCRHKNVPHVLLLLLASLASTLSSVPFALSFMPFAPSWAFAASDGPILKIAGG